MEIDNILGWETKARLDALPEEKRKGMAIGTCARVLKEMWYKLPEEQQEYFVDLAKTIEEGSGSLADKARLVYSPLHEYTLV